MILIHELIIPGVPLSLQAKSSSHRAAWIARVRAVAHAAVEPADRHEFTDVAVVIIQFCFDWSHGDLDNIAKPILDGLAGAAFSGDEWVTQLTLRRTELGDGRPVELVDAPDILLAAVQASYVERRDFVYVRIADDVDHRRMPWSS